MTPRRFVLGLLHGLRLFVTRQLALVEMLVMKVRGYGTIPGEKPGITTRSIAVVITTFEARQEECCLPLIASLRAGGCDWPVVVALNGNLSSSYSVPRRQSFLAKASSCGDTSFVTFRAFTSLSRMWNLAIQATAADIVVVLNDDVVINSSSVMQDLNRLVEVAEAEGIVLGNNSFSHFCVSRPLMEQLRWFDERFVGVGEEDGDFAWRYERRAGRIPPSLVTPSLKNISHPSGTDLKMGRFSGASKIFSQVKYVPSDAGLTGGRYPRGVEQAVPDFDPHPLSGLDGVREEILRNASRDRIMEYFDEHFRLRG